jgi:TolC family type I secretion outer membrane protein
MHRSRWLLVLCGVWAGLALAPARAQSLGETLAEAYRSNPTLLAARAELRAVNEGVPQELSNWRPLLSIDTSAGAQRIDLGSAVSAETTYPFEASFGIRQPLYRGGRTVAGVARAEADVRAQRARLTSVEQSVLLDAGTAYMDVWRDQAVLGLNESNEQVLQRELEATRDRFEVGELTRTDVAQAESRLARATATRVSAAGDLAVSRAIFKEVAGLTPGVLEAPAPLPGLPASLSEAVAAAEDKNPDLRAATFAEEGAQHQVRTSYGELLPEVSVTAELTHSRNQLRDDTETSAAQILALVTVPLYQKGLVSSRVREDKQAANQRRIEIDETRRRVVQDSVDAWEILVAAQAQSVSFQAEVRSSEIALEGVRQENAVGARTILDVLDAESWAPRDS